MNGPFMDLVLAACQSVALSLIAKATVVVLAGLLATTLARRSSASVRHLILTSAFGALLALPLAASVVPSLDVTLAHVGDPSRTAVEPVGLASPIRSDSPAAPVTPTRSPVLVATTSPSAPVRAVSTGTRTVPPLTNASAPARTPEGRSRPSPARPTTEAWAAVVRVLFAVWVLGVVVWLLPAVVGACRLRGIRASGRSSPRAQALVDACVAETDVRRSILALESDRALAPMTFGLVCPVIVLPPDAPTWSDDDLRRTIVHELEHIRRRDWLVHCGAYVTAAPYWFHPLVWIARRRLDVEAERACDDAVLRGAEGPAYAEQLLRLARRLSPAVVEPSVLMASPSDLAIRVGALLDRLQPRRRITGRLAAVMALAATTLLMTVAPLRAVVARRGDGVGPTMPTRVTGPAVARTPAQGPQSLPLPTGANILIGRVLTLGSDAPVGDAVVTLVGYFDASGRPTQVPELRSPFASAPRRVLTTSDGSFMFRDLPAGPYSISLNAFGYVNDDFDLHVIDVTNQKTPTDVAFRVWRTGAISGTVADEHGDPVVGVPLTAFRAETTGSGVALRGNPGTAVTDDRGAYRLAGLRPGRYVVGVMSSSWSLPVALAGAIEATASNRDEFRALTTTLLAGGTPLGVADGVSSGAGQRVGDFVLQRPGPPPLVGSDGRMLTYATTLYPGATMTSDATVIPLGSAEDRTGVDIPVRFTPTVAVSGVVTGPDGPMANLTVSMLPASGAYVRPLGYPRAITDASGAFRFLAISPGAYTLEGRFAPLGRPNPGTPPLGGSQPLTVGDRDLTALTLTLTTGAHVSGRVVFDGQAPPPLALPEVDMPSGSDWIQVSLRSVGPESWGGGPSHAGPDGTFTTPGTSPGRYLLSAVVGPGPSGWTLESVSQGGRPVPDDVIDLGTAGGSDVVLTVTSTPTRLSGSLRDGRGAPDSSAKVIVFPADSTLWREGVVNTRRMRLVAATSAATFDLSGLAPGAYYLAAVAADQVTDWQDPSFLDRLISGATRITLGAHESKIETLTTMTPRDR